MMIIKTTCCLTQKSKVKFYRGKYSKTNFWKFQLLIFLGSNIESLYYGLIVYTFCFKSPKSTSERSCREVNFINGIYCLVSIFNASTELSVIMPCFSHSVVFALSLSRDYFFLLRKPCHLSRKMSPFKASLSEKHPFIFVSSSFA